MRTSLFSLLAVAVLALAVPAMAQSELTVSGTVVSSTPTQIVVKTADGREMTFAVDAQSTVPSGLMTDNPVTVVYHDMGNNTLHAARVTSSTTTTTRTPSTTTTTTRTESTTSRTEPPPAAPTEPMPESTSTGTSSTRMPATASNLPLVGLAGLLILVGGLGVRALRRQRA
jgi:hypothetical protein